MSKLSLEALKMRAEAVASEDLLATISGGTENACHDGVMEILQKNAEIEAEMYKKISESIADWWNSLWD